MVHPDGETRIRQQVVGQRLSAVTFVMDYIQLLFDPPPTINVYTPITVRSGGRTAVSGEETFRNLICEQIPKTVASIAIVDGESFSLRFEDDSIISISLHEQDRQGGDAVDFLGADNVLVFL